MDSEDIINVLLDRIEKLTVSNNGLHKCCTDYYKDINKLKKENKVLLNEVIELTKENSKDL